MLGNNTYNMLACWRSDQVSSGWSAKSLIVSLGKKILWCGSDIVKEHWGDSILVGRAHMVAFQEGIDHQLPVDLFAESPGAELHVGIEVKPAQLGVQVAQIISHIQFAFGIRLYPDKAVPDLHR